MEKRRGQTRRGVVRDWTRTGFGGRQPHEGYRYGTRLLRGTTLLCTEHQCTEWFDGLPCGLYCGRLLRDEQVAEPRPGRLPPDTKGRGFSLHHTKKGTPCNAASHPCPCTLSITHAHCGPVRKHPCRWQTQEQKLRTASRRGVTLGRLCMRSLEGQCKRLHLWPACLRPQLQTYRLPSTEDGEPVRGAACCCCCCCCSCSQDAASCCTRRGARIATGPRPGPSAGG